MDKVLIADLIFFVLFTIVIVFLLYRNKSKLKREGIIFLFKTKFGIDSITKFAKKNEKVLKKLKYIIIVVGFMLMFFIVFLLATNVYSYVRFPKQIIEATNGAPPIAPLIPYFPRLFGLSEYFPELYFSYFLIALAIVAIAHEFAHGIFMKLYNVKIKTTGFLFLGPILGAFVEQDEKSFRSKKNSEQMTILGAGVFANLALAIIFFILLVFFFKFAYAPSGYIFTDYAQSRINISSIERFENYSDELFLVITNTERHYITSQTYDLISGNLSNLENYSLIVYIDSPAIRSQLKGAITEIDNKKVKNFEDFQIEMSKKYPNQEVQIKTNYNNEEKVYEIILKEHPTNSSLGFLGVGSKISVQKKSFLSKVVSIILYRDPTIYYETRFNKDIVEYFYHLFYWIALINFFVAMFNMLPVGILDGGRFSYLAILSLTKSERKTKKIYKFIFSTIILIFVLIVLSWVIARFFK
jgi:membrane-associated protease RseP (regulator of RpoE activity)